jgi:hypothetical protein
VLLWCEMEDESCSAALVPMFNQVSGYIFVEVAEFSVSLPFVACSSIVLSQMRTSLASHAKGGYTVTLAWG